MRWGWLVPVDFTVQGANELAVIAAHLKRTGDREVRKELFAGLNRATKPLKADVKRSALDTLPRRGGLASVISKAKLSTSNRASGKNPGVRITGASPGHALRPIDAGEVRHPVFGNNVWVTQKVTPGFFTKPLEAGVDTVRKELLDVLEQIAAKLVAGP